MSCNNRGSANPIYPKTPYVSGCNSGKNNNNFFVPEGFSDIKDEEVVSNSPQIQVTKEVIGNIEKFKIGFSEYIAPEVDLSVQGYASSSLKGNPVLLGETIDEVRLTWVINKQIESQSLANNGGLSVPSLLYTDRSYTYNGVSITEDTSFTITVNDGSGFSEAEQSAVKSIVFGNYYYYGDNADITGFSIAQLQTVLDGLNKNIDQNRNKSLFATGGANEFFIFAYPKRFGLASQIKKDPFVGGYIRMKNVAGVLKQELQGADVESDIVISNGLQSEAYYVYMSGFDNQNDATTPVVIS